MFNFCCFKRNIKKKVKSLQVYNKDYQIEKNKTNQLLKQPLSKIQYKLKNNQVLASVPMASKEFNSNVFQKGVLQSHPKKTILKSEYDSLIQSYRNSNQQWSDPDFLPTASSWGYSDRKAVWKRISDIIPNAKFVQNNFSPSDILQGKFGDCYFLSSLAGLAQRPDRIIRIFPNTQINKNGIYMARILHRGVFQQVVVDDYFPLGEDGNLLSARPAGGSEIWVMILQKCWAKMYGSYQAIDSGFPEQVLRAISSAPTYHFQMVEPYINDPQFLTSLWERMMRSQKKNYIMCAGSVSDQVKQYDKLGLVSGHAYTILQVLQIPDRIVKLRNPWGRKQWQGRAGQNDRNFWDGVRQQIKKSIGYYENIGEDGTFFMLWQDFITYFNTIDFCNYEDNAHYYYQEEKYQNHVPIYYEVQVIGGVCTFILSQDSIRSRSLLSENPESTQLDDATFLLVSLNSDSIQYIQSSSSNERSDFCLTVKDMKPGKYVLVTFMDGISKVIQATLSIYSEKNVTFSKSNAYGYDFLNKIFINHASKNPQKQSLNENPIEWICFGFIKQSKFGYSVAHLDLKSTSSLQIEFDEAQYGQGPFRLLPDNRGKGKLKQICRCDKEIAVVCKIYSKQLIETKNSQQFSIPIPKINRIK